MLVSAASLHFQATHLSTNNAATTNLLSSNTISSKQSAFLKPLFVVNNASSPSLPNTIVTTAAAASASVQGSTSNSSSITLRHVTRTSSSNEPEGGGGGGMVSSASAVACAVRRASTTPVEFVQRIETDQKSKLMMPSPDFQRLCVEQLDLFRRIVDPHAMLSVYVRPAGSYVVDRFELRRVMYSPGLNATDILILVCNFSMPTGLRAAEAVLYGQQVEFIPEHRAVIFPMVKQPFIVGFLVAELPMMEPGTSHGNVQSERVQGDLSNGPSPEEAYASHSSSDMKPLDLQTVRNGQFKVYKFTPEQRSNAINITRSLAMGYVMDQKAMLLQRSSWQNNVRMSNLVEQIRGPLSTIRTLSKMLSIHMKRSEIAYDIVEDILVQGDRIKDTLQELQDAVYLTKANIVRYNEETLKKMQNSTYPHQDSLKSQLSDDFSRDSLKNSVEPLSLNAATKDLEMPMPPLALAPLQQHGVRPCNVSEVLADLVGAVTPLANKQQRVVELCEFAQSLQVAVEETALRQALGNLIEGALLRTHVGGKVEIVSTGAPAGGALVVIDDDGPDMHYMTQMHSLAPFGGELFSKNMIEDNMTWNFVAGLTVAREILESFGCVVRVISPRITDAALGAGGTRVEVWLPSTTMVSDINGLAHDHEA